MMFKWLWNLINGNELEQDKEVSPSELRVSPYGLALIKYYEGYRGAAYQCSAGVWTVGYGSTKYPNGKPVRKGDYVSKQMALNLLKNSVSTVYAQAVRDLVKRPLTQYQFDALVSFVYNVGENALKKSTLLQKVNSGFSSISIAEEFAKWNKYVNPKTNELEPLEGLTKRREAEAQVYQGVEHIAYSLPSLKE